MRRRPNRRCCGEAWAGEKAEGNAVTPSGGAQAVDGLVHTGAGDARVVAGCCCCLVSADGCKRETEIGAAEG